MLAASEQAIEADSRGSALLGLVRLDEAVDSFQRALDRNPPDVHVMLIRGSLEAARQNRAQQEQLPAEQHKTQGSAAFMAKELETAIEHFEAALAAAEPGKLASEAYLQIFCATVQSNLALCQKGLQNWAAAAEHAQTALLLAPASHKIAAKAQRTLDFARTKEQEAEPRGADQMGISDQMEDPATDDAQSVQ